MTIMEATGMDFGLTEEERELASLAAGFAKDKISPIARQAWEDRRCPTDLLREMGAAGLLGLLVPEKWGGIGMSTVGFVAAMEEIGAADQSIAAAWQAHLTIGSLPLVMFGTDAQRERWLRPLAEGRVLGAFGLTEPEAGSDVASLRTTATRGDGGWVLRGQKIFISNSGTDMSYGAIILARTGERDGRATFGSFVVEKDTPGFRIGNKLRGIGWRSLDTRQLFFDDVWVSDEHVVGDPDRGMSQFLAALETGRISIAALSTSLIKAVLRLSLEQAGRRVQFGKPIAGHQAIQFKLADMATDLEAARLMTYSAASLRDQGRPFAQQAAMAKLFASAAAVRAASEAVQIHGGMGFMEETDVARFYCDAKVLEIGEGTNEIQRILIARHLGC
jgi:short-chain 2-methylacyl-CoA dehydrogenase